MFAERLRELREKHGLTQKELGNALNVTSQTISNYEIGKREPEISEFIKLADYFGVSIDYLIGRTNTMMEQNEKIYYSVIESIVVPKSFKDNQIDAIIRDLANGKDYSWSRYKEDLKIK